MFWDFYNFLGYQESQWSLVGISKFERPSILVPSVPILFDRFDSHLFEFISHSLFSWFLIHHCVFIILSFLSHPKYSIQSLNFPNFYNFLPHLIADALSNRHTLRFIEALIPNALNFTYFITSYVFHNVNQFNAYSSLSVRAHE